MAPDVPSLIACLQQLLHRLNRMRDNPKLTSRRAFVWAVSLRVCSQSFVFRSNFATNQCLVASQNGTRAEIADRAQTLLSPESHMTSAYLGCWIEMISRVAAARNEWHHRV